MDTSAPHPRVLAGTPARGAWATLVRALAPAGAVAAGIAVLVVDGHGLSWLGGLVAGVAVSLWAAFGRNRVRANANASASATAALAAAAGAAPEAGAGTASTTRTPSAARPERRTEDAVRALERSGWRFLHNVAGPDGSYDHIAVGHGGLILLESLSPDGVVTMRGGQPVLEFRDGPEDQVHLDRLRSHALTDATTLRESVQRIAERRLWVQAVVVLWSEFPAGCVTDGRCVYIHGSRLAEWMARRPNQLDEPEAEAVFAAVKRLAQRGPEQYLPVAV